MATKALLRKREGCKIKIIFLKKLLTKDVERGNLLIVTDEDERKIKKSLAIWLGI
ncbi:MULTISPECIES: hypothetical protein [Thermoactinomyces]|jgi:hypothetical protein|uniref:hypothetical protein n=1 Tax=Thermoactinomyces TaxID=2023 RepID=UPI000AA97090|nr:MULTISPECIES: hypothetical protein [Thermoactinomyces]MBH8584464.1 hypothetical protein [Thermoactinomyces sp. CICC 10735]MBH8586940.1 hypothetical protein [Thermoactinomyces sp. CICC 10520]MBI0392870.1 hypothetical protein [Thermoactinomyces sp. CICC 24226]